MKKFALCLALALMAASAGAKEWKTVRIGVDASYPPFESKSPDGKIVGFAVDLTRALCTRMNVKCVWVEQDFDSMIPALKAKKFDAIVSSMTVTDKRRQQIDFSDKLFDAGTRMVVHAGSPLQPNAQSLKGRRVGVEQGTTQETYAKTYWESKGVTVVPYQNQDQVYTDLLSGRLDASLQDEVQASVGFLKTPRGKDFTWAGAALSDPKTLGEGTAIGLRKEDGELKARFNQAMKEIHQDGTFDKLAKPYFDFDIFRNR
ncbi:ABC transporter substrate-binding protein [Paraburkholderia bonniea]|uniref:ABC transporter substrate-binding protein n=1 Tax=Paraburkholderia bonniea TaxID=2152891 RepID=UPI0012909C47|nr:ABC transporter substrate-binding protein [Paraburkholderia bonniea]WJF89413.1 ABC transporter substrate-binding protein [Paraburkholderia bonniea]WJF92728.1 ABC transporter substrate-binding protein [Paraburkholderia bonniea]